MMTASDVGSDSCDPAVPCSRVGGCANFVYAYQHNEEHMPAVDYALRYNLCLPCARMRFDVEHDVGVGRYAGEEGRRGFGLSDVWNGEVYLPIASEGASR